MRAEETVESLATTEDVFVTPKREVEDEIRSEGSLRSFRPAMGDRPEKNVATDDEEMDVQIIRTKRKSHLFAEDEDKKDIMASRASSKKRSNACERVIDPEKSYLSSSQYAESEVSLGRAGI